MSNLIFVKAVEDRTARIPGTNDVVPTEGVEVQDSSYWQRRVSDGDVELSTKPKPAANKADKETK